MSRKAHLIGSLGLKDAETCFSTVAEILGDCCPRIPDGETGGRGYWIRWQNKTFESVPDLFVEEVMQTLPGFKDTVKRPFYRPKPGVDAARLELPALGYADEAIASYAIFKRLADAGKIPAGTRFQVCVPTAVALLGGFIVADSRAAMEGPVERAMQRDLERLQKAIPADRLSIQWDVCYEVIGADGGPKLHYADAVEGSIERVARLCGLVGKGVELGIHLCYGDPGHKHIVEPKDLGICVAFANGICAASPRPVEFMHMPVPRDRNDDAFFAPLKQLALPAATRLILGLVHYTDGSAGTRKRIATAEGHVKEFDVATECGFGRRDPETVPALLRVHKEVCA
ncbi:MAG: hypothetical protein O2979_06670 [Proteobacteria bacterium]|nr:hypothetical protein [Pseudomonadota bacterium]